MNTLLKYKPYRDWTYIIMAMVIAVLFSVLAGFIHAAITEPTPSHTLDGWGVEPFKADAPMRTATALTASYVETDVVNISGYGNMILCFDIVQGGLTSFEYRVWLSKNSITWYVEATESVGAGVITDEDAYNTKALTGDVAYFKVLSCRGVYLKLQVKGTGVMAGNTLAVDFMGVQ